MTIGAGVRLGPYEIVAPLGAGGMGEVYRAKDTRLDRTVAIKVLPAHTADNAEQRQRLDREARAIAALTHPHICTLHDIGHQDGIDYLVMEYLDGETLAERLTKGPLALDQVFMYAIEIAEALDRAHRAGIVHRDLKPGNVMLTKTGAPRQGSAQADRRGSLHTKLLDFGLAKLVPRVVGVNLQGVSVATALPTSPASLTGKGIILGTLQYMAPEQLEGKETDARTDLFALGAVIYEMATGKKAFTGESQASLIAAILTSEPPVMAADRLVPRALDRTVRKCLAKDPDRRWQTARDLADELTWIAASEEPVVAARSRRRPLVTLVAASLAVALGVAVGFGVSRGPTLPRSVVRSVIPIAPADALSQNSGAPVMAISPDGTRLVFVGSHDSTTHLYLRNVDQLAAEPIPGTEGGTFPFFSPDGRWIGFVAGDKLKKVSLNGGAPFIVCSDCSPIGASWAPDGTIALSYGRAGLWRVSAAGGTAQRLTTADKDKGERTLRYPEFLPDGKAVIFTAGGWDEDSFDDARIEVLSLATGEKKVLIQGGMCARYLASGHLVYARSGSLYAVPFNLSTRSVMGEPVRVLEGVATIPGLGGAHFFVSAAGTLVYVPGGPMGVSNRLVWIDRGGQVKALTDIVRAFRDPRISPDGSRIAVVLEGALSHVWVYDRSRGTLTQLTFGENIQGNPVWTPDGKRLAYPWNLGGKTDIFWQPANGSGEPEQLTKAGSEFPRSWSPDGKILIFEHLGQTPNNFDIWVLSRDGDRNARPLVQDRADQTQPAISPDGHWLVYRSNESGRDEIYMRQFPSLADKTQVSANGGDSPVWSRDGRELFYREGEKKLMAVAVTIHPAFSATRARVVFEDKEGRYLQNGYDVAPDGRLVMVDAHENWPSQLNMVQNWFEELKTKVPTGR